MITRIINGIEFDIEETESNEVYFEQDMLQEIGGGDLESILNMFYNQKQTYLPLSLTWELTSKCNFFCPFCYIHTKNNDEHKNCFSFSLVKNELEKLIERGLFICYLTGGECLLHPDFIEIYTFLKKHGVLVVVLTNASLLNEQHFEVFKKYKPYKIEISIYGIERTFSPNAESDCIKVLENIMRLNALGINVVCKTPINKYTESQFKNISNWCQKNSIDYYYSTELFDTYDGISMQKFKVELPLDDILQERVSLTRVRKKKLFDCKASKYSFLISADFSLRPCFAFYNIDEAIFVADEETLLEKLDQMIRYINSYKDVYLSYCTGCVYSEFCQECIVTQYNRENLKEYMHQKCQDIKKRGIV